MKEILCIRFPREIRAEIQLQNDELWRNCHFSDSIDHISEYTLIALPVENFIFLAEKLQKTKIIAFGPAESLEEAFLLGASDYIKPPWNYKEFFIRILQAVNLDRMTINNHTISISWEGLMFDQKTIPLTSRELSILMLLNTNRNTLVKYETISHFIDIQSDKYENTLYVYICRIKKKLKENMPELYPDYINIIRISKKGYILKYPCG